MGRGDNLSLRKLKEEGQDNKEEENDEEQIKRCGSGLK
jgi:hypothetical protein